MTYVKILLDSVTYRHWHVVPYDSLSHAVVAIVEGLAIDIMRNQFYS